MIKKVSQQPQRLIVQSLEKFTHQPNLTNQLFVSLYIWLNLSQPLINEDDDDFEVVYYFSEKKFRQVWKPEDEAKKGELSINIIDWMCPKVYFSYTLEGNTSY